MIYVGDIRLSVLFKEDRYQEDNRLTIVEISSKKSYTTKNKIKILPGSTSKTWAPVSWHDR